MSRDRSDSATPPGRPPSSFARQLISLSARPLLIARSSLVVAASSVMSPKDASLFVAVPVPVPVPDGTPKTQRNLSWERTFPGSGRGQGNGHGNGNDPSRDF